MIRDSFRSLLCFICDTPIGFVQKVPESLPVSLCHVCMYRLEVKDELPREHEEGCQCPAHEDHSWLK